MSLKAYNTRMDNREQVISDCRLMLEMSIDNSMLDARIDKVMGELG